MPGEHVQLAPLSKLASGTAAGDKDSPLKLQGSERTGGHTRLTLKLEKLP